MANDHPIITLASRRAWECPWYAVRQDRIRLPNGTEGVYNVVEMHDAVWVVPVTTSGEIVLLWHYRYPLQAWGWELPSGRIEDGQSPEDAARRELAEEAGGAAQDWRFLLRAPTMKGIGDELAYLYLATGVRLGATQHEPAEVLTVHSLPAARVLAMARAGEISDAVSVLALLLAEPFLTVR
ncbi:MAG: NUDIX hydrolase [Chloroflexi bacterium]|nr:NUDIX hydrolase [Chloroflexota bacterium]